MLARLRYQLKHGKLFRSFLGVGGMYMLGIPLGLVINIVLARSLGPAEFGQYVFIVSALALLALPAAGGLPQLLTREVARFSHTADWGLYRGAVRAAHIWVLLVTAVIVVGFLLARLADFLPAEGKWALLGIAIILVPLQGLNSVRNGTIKGLGFPALAELPMQTIQPVLLLGGVVALALLGLLTISGALWVLVGATAITFVIASLLFLRVRPHESSTHEPVYRNARWLRSLWPFTLISLVGTFNAQIGIVLLGILGTDEAVGVLRVADRGAKLVVLPLALLNMVIAPHIVRASQSDSKGELQMLSKKTARWSLLLAVIPTLILIIWGQSILDILFGHEYGKSGYTPMVILVIGQIFNVAMGPVALILAMTGKEKNTLVGQGVGLAVIACFSALLVDDYGAIGVAIAISFGVVSTNLILGYGVFKNIKIRPGFI